MKNSKTTVAGILAIVAGVATAASQFLTGHPLDLTLLTTLITAVTVGVGLINAADGQ